MPITQNALDEFVIYDIPVASKSGMTTVIFPSEISGLYAKSVAIQEQENAGFLISFTPGNFYFSIRALKPAAEDHLTVIFNRSAYVLHLKVSDEPFCNAAFYLDQRTGKDGERVAIIPERLLSLMDKAKAYPLFAKNHPEALAGVLHADPGIANYYDNFTVRIRDVWRFEQEDTLIFRLELENTSDRVMIVPRLTPANLEALRNTQTAEAIRLQQSYQSIRNLEMAIEAERQFIAVQRNANFIARLLGRRKSKLTRSTEKLAAAVDRRSLREMQNLLFKIKCNYRAAHKLYAQIYGFHSYANRSTISHVHRQSGQKL